MVDMRSVNEAGRSGMAIAAAAAIAAPKMSFFLLVSHSRSSSAVPAIRPVRASAPTVTSVIEKMMPAVASSVSRLRLMIVLRR